MNATDLEELEQRFDDTSCAQSLADPADPVRQVDVSRGTSCTPAEFRALELVTRQQIRNRLDQWKNKIRSSPS